MKKIWSPHMIYGDVDNGGDGKMSSYMTIIRDTENKFYFRKPSKLSNARVYNGSENELKMSSEYSTKLHCSFEMFWFPFDLQTCFVKMYPQGKLQYFVDLNLEEITFEGDTNFGSFELVKIEECRPAEMNIPRDMITIGIRMKRNMAWPMIANLTPMLLMTLVGHLTFYIKPESFDTAVQVLITTMLVQTTQ